ncbi:MAG: RagB/SusD family nutrient uptake outer membrane protein, partial [Mediterranea sp.]|nr:RagB/SusD family nutrient uptake outer membrane protein [Mediterranea sp.]
EAKFLRAWFYFRLNELFGREGLGVPIYTEPTSVDESNKGQSPEADVWKLITDDLTDAIDDPNLPNMDPNGRVTKGAAYALRGKAYLYQGAKYKETTDGSVNVTVNTDLLNKAIADFDKVKECGYGLFGDYKGLFSEENEHCNEMIFSIGHTDDKGYGTNSQKFVGSRFAYSGTGNGWGNQTPAPAGIDQYEYTDGSPFNWDDIIPDYDKLTPKERAVYFLRDTLDINSEIVKQEGDQKPLETLVRSSVKTLVEKAGKTAKEYMPYGNEIRIRKAYQNRDPRLEANIITPYAGFNGGYSFAGAGNPMVVYSRWPLGAKSKTPDVTKRADLATDDSNYFTYFHRKFVYEGAGLSRREDGGLDEPLIRYANVLLWKAEAYVELDKLPEAKACVKEVRDRVKMPILDRYFFDQNSARDYVRAERRREFVNEGVDFFDEMRWYTWKEIKFNQGKGTQTVWGEVWQSYTWPTSNNLYIWPVPQSEVERNPNLTRTPGWNY